MLLFNLLNTCKFAKKKIKKSVIDKNFADDHCDKWKKNTIPLERGIKEYFIKNQPKWDEKIAEMEKREALKKIKDDRLQQIQKIQLI